MIVCGKESGMGFPDEVSQPHIVVTAVNDELSIPWFELEQVVVRCDDPFTRTDSNERSLRVSICVLWIDVEVWAIPVFVSLACLPR